MSLKLLSLKENASRAYQIGDPTVLHSNGGLLALPANIKLG
jgi:hypothetical protein